MDANEVKDSCERILATYKADPEEGHIYEDKFLQRILRTLGTQIASLSGDATELVEFQQNVRECMGHIDALLKTSRTKWYS